MVQNIKDLLVGIYRDDSSASSAFLYGLSLARQADAHLSVCALSPEMAVTHAYISEVATRLVEEENRRLRGIAQNLAEQARKDAASQGVACETEILHAHYGALAAAFARKARLHELTIFDAESDAIGLSRGFLEEALFNSGTPLIIVPKGVDTFQLKNVIVAWDGSAKASRAVNDALPFLRAAKQVEIVTISGEKDISKSVSGAELAPHLARHGINCTVKELAAQNGDVGGTLRTQASYFRADLIVMGAFVHSRLRQLVLGGATHAMLKNSKVPLFLSY